MKESLFALVIIAFPFAVVALPIQIYNLINGSAVFYHYIGLATFPVIFYLGIGWYIKLFKDLYRRIYD